MIFADFSAVVKMLLNRMAEIEKEEVEIAVW